MKKILGYIFTPFAIVMFTIICVIMQFNFFVLSRTDMIEDVIDWKLEYIYPKKRKKRSNIVGDWVVDQSGFVWEWDNKLKRYRPTKEQQ